jgi:hypothetical protein
VGKESRLIKIGRTDVRSALGFFWHDNHKIYVAATPEDIVEWKEHGYTDGDLHKMAEIETAFRSSSALKFISWCKSGCIVRQGATQVTFEYDDKKVVLRMR